MIMINYFHIEVTGLYGFFLSFSFVFKSEGERCTTWAPHLPSGGQQEGRS